MKFQHSVFLLLVLLLLSCSHEEVSETLTGETKTYLHLSHTRTSENPTMDSVVENIDFSRFDMLWLGGDLAHLTSADDNTMQHIDSIFNLRKSTTLWAPGNHDYTDLDRIKRFTKRPPYYAFHRNGITLVVLDTQDSLSNIVAGQKEFLFGVLDTISESSHLILLHHKLIWMYNHAMLEPRISSVSNAGLDSCFYCINPNNFNTEIYPALVGIRKKGIEVLCIGGDIGFKTNEFEFITSDGIQFLASGINANKAGNKALLFHHDLQRKKLTWAYRLLKDL